MDMGRDVTLNGTLDTQASATVWYGKATNSVTAFQLTANTISYIRCEYL